MNKNNYILEFFNRLNPTRICQIIIFVFFTQAFWSVISPTIASPSPVFTEDPIYYNKAHKLPELFSELGVAEERSQDIASQLKLIDSLKLMNDEFNLGMSYIELSRLYRLNVQNDKAKESLFKSLEIMLKINSLAGLAEANSSIGMFYWRRSEFDSAIVYMEEAIIMYKELKDTLNYGIDLNSLGSSYYQVGLFDKALSNYIESNRIRMLLGDTAGVAKTYNNIGLIFLDLAYFNKAKEYFEEGLKWALESKDSNTVGYTYNNFGTYYEREGNLESALFYYLKSIDTYKDKGLSIGILNQKNIGRVYLAKKDFLKAKDHLSRALEFTKILEDKTSQAEVYMYLGILSLQKKNYNDAIAKIDTSLSLSIKMGRRELIKDNHKVLAEIYEKTGDKNKALLSYKKFHEAYITIYNQQVGMRVSVLEEQQKIEMRNLELSIRELKLQGEEFTTKFISAIAVGLMLIVLVMIIYNRKINKSNQRLKLQNSQIENQKKELDKQNQYLHTLSATKNKLFSILAHDLRNPFHSMLGFSDLLISEFDSLSRKEQLEYIEIIKGGLNSTYELLVNLLFWSQANTGSLEKRPDVFEFMRLVISNIKFVESNALQKGIEIKFNPGSPVNVFADENMIEIVLRNIITNAIKYTDRNGEIEIAIKVSGEFLFCSIKDTGIGIDEVNLSHIFDLEKKLNRNGTEGEKGTGLGLVLSKEFIEINGGTISVSSTLGAGSTFEFSIPLAKQQDLVPG